MRSLPDLFRGRDDVFGYYGNISNAKASGRGKRVAAASTKREPVTSELWQRHLSGESRLGIVPVLKDGKCWWFCIDVDHYQEHGLLEEICAKIDELGLPLCVTRSKSGGAHIWCFLDEPMVAAKMRAVAENFRKKLQLPDDHIDIFPKQDKAHDIGNWVNMPYYGEACRGFDGVKDLSVDDFVALANSRLVLAADLRVKSSEKTAALNSGAPPCIDHMREEGVPEGHRNDAMTHFCVYAMRAFPDDWKLKAQEFNEESCDPPVDKQEMRNIFKSVQKGGYQFLCRVIKEIYCDKATCKKREFGIGQDAAFEIENIEKIDGELPIYRVTIDGIRFQVTLDQLFLYNSFKKIALGATNRFLPMMKQQEWEEMMRDTLEMMEITEAAADTQMRDRVIKAFQRFAENSSTLSLKVSLERGTPFYDGKQIIFRGDDFMQIIDRQLVRVTRDQTWVYMRDWGTVQIECDIDGKKIPFWSYVVKGPLWFQPEEQA